jgi:hypothetical protein
VDAADSPHKTVKPSEIVVSVRLQQVANKKTETAHLGRVCGRVIENIEFG